ncbi:S-protein homolog 29 [Lathyrus oleraceus]|uniref:S-protein homolog n=1 Tax=Pisum sativum TaxID=3888 RepID=A0A9D4ZW30_PEA|nr:S-protein homolog 29-like [Pisum sativum]KAI5386796.1 hypothetical protein KIW84_073079 [Pisum sativum]
MANPNSMTIKFSILLIIILLVEASGLTFNPKVHVYIRNDIPPHPTPLNLTVHCKSKDDDLGFHTLVYGEIYTFSFRPSLFPQFSATLFFCSFAWKGSPDLHYLDVYDEDFDDCIVCSWKITKTGGCKPLKQKPDACVVWNTRIALK